MDIRQDAPLAPFGRERMVTWLMHFEFCNRMASARTEYY